MSKLTTKDAIQCTTNNKYRKNQSKSQATHSLEDRRIKLCLKFARKNLKSDNCLFKKVAKNVNTRQSAKLVQEYKCRTSKYKKSSIPYLVRLLNSNCKK